MHLGTWGLPRLRNVTDAVPFAGSTSGEAEHVSQGHTDRHGHGHTQRKSQDTAPDKVLPSTAPTDRTCMTKNKDRQASPLPLLGWQRHNITSAARFRFTNTDTFADPSKYWYGPLFLLYTPWVPYLPAGPAQCLLANTWHSRLIPQAPHTCGCAWAEAPPT